MSRRNRWGLFLPLLLLLSLVTLQLYFDYVAVHAKAECEVSNRSILLASKVEAEMNRAKALLSHMEANIRPEYLSQAIQREHEDEVRGLLAPLLTDFATVNDCWYFDANGDLLYSTIAKVPPFNVSDRSYFQKQLKSPGEFMFISEVLFGHSTNKSSLYLSTSLHTADGRFAGVAIVRMDLESMKRMFREVDLGLDGVMMLRRVEDGAQILRLPEEGESPNARLPPQSLIRRALELGQNHGTILERSPVDGRLRLYAFQRVHGSPFFVGVGISPKSYQAIWWHHVLYAAIVLVLSSIGFVISFKRIGA